MKNATFIYPPPAPTEVGSSTDLDRARVSLMLDRKVKLKIEDLRVRSSATSLTEVIRRSLILYDVILTNYSRGGVFVFRHSDGTGERIHLV